MNSNTVNLPEMRNLNLVNSSKPALKVFIVGIFVFLNLLVPEFASGQITLVGTTQTTTGTNTVTINKPSGVQSQDFLIASITYNETSTLIDLDVAPTGPVGWILIQDVSLDINNTTGEEWRGAVFYKIADASDLAATNYLFDLDDQADGVVGGILAFTGVNSATPFDVAPGATPINVTTATSLTDASITTVNTNSAILMIGMVANDLSISAWNTVNGGTLNEVLDLGTSTKRVGAAWKTQPAAGATGIGTATIGSSEQNGALLLALRACNVPPTVNPIGGGAPTICGGCTTPPFTNTTAGGVWSIVNGTGSASISAGGAVTGLTAGTVTVRYTVTVSGCRGFASTALTVTSNAPVYCTTCNTSCSEPIGTNPAISASCADLKIAIVLDESGSIGTNSAQVEAGVMAFVNALSCTGTQIALIEFNTSARKVFPDYQIINNETVTAIQNYFDGVVNVLLDPDGASYSPLDGTNWQAGVLAANTLSTPPDLVIFVTDGLPNYVYLTQNPNYTVAGTSCAEANTTPEENAAKVANSLKSQGARIFVMGVGGAASEAGTISQISGTTAYNGSNGFINSDYSTGSFNQLAADLAAFAAGLCPFTATATGQSVCQNGNNGSITVAIPSAVFPYSYKYFNQASPTVIVGSGNNLNSSPLVINGLSVGNYRVEVTVTLPGNCTRVETLLVTIAANAANAAASITGTVNPTCSNLNGGTATLTITNTVAPYKITLKKAGVIQAGYPVTQNGLTYTATGLNAGSYTFELQDANLCNTDIDAFTLLPSPPPVAGITNNSGTTVLTCTRTSISVTATGGGTYSWNGGATPGTAANSFSAPGTYTVTVTSAAGCTDTESITITQNITPPVAGITNNSGTTVLTCATTSISVTATGGGTYSWNGGATPGTAANSFNAPGTYTVTVTSANGCTDTEAITITQTITPPIAGITNNSGTTVLTCTITSINVTATGGGTYSWNGGATPGTATNSFNAPGTYTVTVTSATGCTDTESITITRNITVPVAAITNNTGSTVLTCTRTSINVTATGGVSYSWNGGATPGTAANSFSAPGTYTVLVTSANGCTDTESITITQTITPPIAGITNNSGTTVLTCTTTSINVTATGGGTYSWNGGTTPGTAANSFSALGTYTVTVTAANGCTDTESITITQTITPPIAGIINNSGTTILTCTTTSINVTATGAGTYSWNGGATPGTAANSFNAPGTYTVTVTSANGCTDTESITITRNITPPTAVITNNSGTLVLTCTTTSISVTATGGVTYSWNGGATPGTAANSFNAPGTYTVTVTSANGCTDTESITITTNVTPPTAAITNNSGTLILTCTTTSINVTATGGGTYSWNGGATPGTAANSFSTPGTYTVTVTSGNGCTDTESIIITQNIPPPTLTCPGTQTLTSGQNCITTLPDYVTVLGITATDGCGNPVLTITQSPLPGSIFTSTTTSQVITIRATDSYGNSSTCTFTVNFVDLTPPTINCNNPANITATTGVGNTSCQVTVTYNAPTAQDNCGPVTPVRIAGPASGSLFSVGVTTITYQAQDAAGNTSQCSFTITVVDNTAPALQCSVNRTVTAVAGCTYTHTNNLWDATAQDNCLPATATIRYSTDGGVTFPFTTVNGISFPLGSTTVIVRATDALNNQAFCSFTVFVVDNQPPVLNGQGTGGCVAPFTVCANNIGCTAIVPNTITATGTGVNVTDNCGVALFEWDLSGATPTASGILTAPLSGTNTNGRWGLPNNFVFGLGVTQVQYRFTDTQGNFTTCQFFVTVVNNVTGTISSNGAALQNASTTSTVTFRGIGSCAAPGTQQYRFFYSYSPTGPAGPFIPQPPVTTFVGFDITTVAQSNANVGTFSYRIDQAQDLTTGCTSPPLSQVTTITVFVGADLTLGFTPFQSLSFPATGSTNNFGLSIIKIGPTAAAGNMTVRIPKTSAFTTSLPNVATLSGNPVNNANWSLNTADPSFWVLTTSVPIPVNGSNTAGLMIQRNAGIASNTSQPMSATLQAGSGGDQNAANNTTTVVLTAQ